MVEIHDKSPSTDKEALLVNYIVTGSNGTDHDVDIPSKGRVFDDDDEIYNFYKEYAKKIGFPVHRRARKRNDDGCLRCVSFGCARGGKHRRKVVNPRGSMETGCGAYITCRRRQGDGKWVMSVVSLEHNHKCNPEDVKLYKCFEPVCSSAQKQRRIDLNSGGSTAKKKAKIGVQNEGVGCAEMGAERNAVGEGKRLRIGQGDVEALLKFFAKMNGENSGFYWQAEFDEENYLKNVFWADGMSRAAYKEFGDVVSFDTKYLVDKYDLPLVAFVGVNHHGQTILLGCGLVSSEDTEAFVWLFTEWLMCMSGKPPKAIITDQAKAIQNAIEIVFPQTRHRWCLWNVMKKLPDKFGKHDKCLDITSDMKAAVYDTQSSDEFEQLWHWMLVEYGLQDDQWLKDLFEERSRWVPCYLKDTFWAGMSTTQRNEGSNMFFDGYMNARSSIKQFAEQYEVVLRKKVEKEKLADDTSSQKTIPLVTTYPMEKQIQKRYTNSKFKEFQVELLAMLYCNFTKIEKTPTHMIYNIQEDVYIEDFRKKMTFHVTYNEEECDVQCTCQKFTFDGIQCRHALSVLCHNGIRKLPDKYILRWWRKDVIRAHTRVKVGFSCWTNDDATKRYHDLCTKFAELAALAANDETLYRDIVNWVDCKKKELQQTVVKAK
ncbi:hypothetical protein MKX03_001012 [Papaver bracteatum]|nr:hypothetical protein MKX03_001012 [Papaver bracteatum]